MPDELEKPEPHPFDVRGGKKKPPAHRALLLYAMQDADMRSRRAVGQAMQRGESTIRGWADRLEWEERIEAAGPTVQVQAVRWYRRMYMATHGDRELHYVERNMSVPILPEEVMPKTGPGIRESVQNARARGDSPQVRSFVDRTLSGVEYAIGKTFQRMRKEGFDGVPFHHLPRLIKLQQELEDARRPPPMTGGAAVVDTARVALAKAQKTDLIEAYHEDAQELVAILGALRAKDEAPKGQVMQFPGAEEAS